MCVCSCSTSHYTHSRTTNTAAASIHLFADVTDTRVPGTQGAIQNPPCPVHEHEVREWWSARGESFHCAAFKHTHTHSRLAKTYGHARWHALHDEGDGEIYCEGLIINFRNSRAMHTRTYANAQKLAGGIRARAHIPYISGKAGWPLRIARLPAKTEAHIYQGMLRERLGYDGGTSAALVCLRTHTAVQRPRPKSQ